MKPFLSLVPNHWAERSGRRSFLLLGDMGVAPGSCRRRSLEWRPRVPDSIDTNARDRATSIHTKVYVEQIAYMFDIFLMPSLTRPDMRLIQCDHQGEARAGDRKSTRLNSSHVRISYAVFCLK